MKNGRIALLGALLLAGCAPAPAPVAQLPAPLPAPVELTFWFDETLDPSSDPRVLSVHEHPCGAASVLAVTSVPVATPTAGTDHAVEFDRHGRKLHEWRLPIDFVVDGVVDDYLGITRYTGETYWVDLEGGLHERQPGPSRRFAGESCPADSGLGPSAYGLCQRIDDARTGRSRLIGWEVPCT